MRAVVALVAIATFVVSVILLSAVVEVTPAGEFKWWVQTTTCLDTDGGKDYYTHGEISVVGMLPRPDECVDDQLIEAYCQAGIGALEGYICPAGCADGACIRP